MSIRYGISPRKLSRRAIWTLGGLVAIAAAPQMAGAQATEEIIVTGSRVSHSGFDSPQPVTTIDSKQIENLGIVNVGDVMRTIPQNTPFFSETNVGFGNFNVGSQLANLRGLNPFFGTRTLTLVDTKRVVPTSEGGAVDLTLIPSMLVDRTEVVTGGASAAYGSDAIAGVVNVILNTKLEGIKAQIDYGATGESDGGDTHASFAFGTAFADQGRGHVLFGAEYQKQDLIGPCSRTRDWCKEGWGVGTNAQFNTPAGVGNGLPNFVVAPDAKAPTSETGVLTSGGVPRQFNANGTQLLPYDPGRFPGTFGRFGGDGTVLGYDLSTIRPAVERYSLLGHLSYELSDRLVLSAEVAYARSDAENHPISGALGPVGAGVTIQPDNAFLTPAVLAVAPTGGAFSRVFLPDVVAARNTTRNQTTRFVAGLEGQLAKKWTWDAYYQHGENENRQQVFHSVVNSGAFAFLNWALDSVHTNPADLTSPIVCRATIAGLPTFRANAAGCVPLNIFGNGNANPAAVEYVYRTQKEDADYEQDVLSANFRSTLAEGWAGPIGFASGIEWRKDRADTTHDIPNQPWYGSYVLSYGLDRGGDIDVLEAYAEVDVPLSKKLRTNFSARETQNEAKSNTGTEATQSHAFTSWKAAAIYDPLEWLRFRATLSRDVRAAGFRELFLPRVDTPGTPGGLPAGITNPWNSNIAESYLGITGGKADLEPETADTTTLGAVLTFERFRFSADYFEIDLRDAITPGGGGIAQLQALVNACYLSGAMGEVCSRVTGYGTTDIVAVDARSINIGKFLTRGYDYEASYDVPLREGNINLRFIGTYLYDMIVDPGLGAPPVDYRGQSGPVGAFGAFNTSPDWQARAWVTYARNRFTTTLETRYIASGSLNALWTESPPGSSTNTRPLTVTDNSVDDRYYFSWSGSYAFPRSNNDRLEIFWVVNNLLDEDPPVAPGGNSYPTNPVFFDTLGRRFRAGVRLAF